MLTLRPLIVGVTELGGSDEVVASGPTVELPAAESVGTPPEVSGTPGTDAGSEVEDEVVVETVELTTVDVAEEDVLETGIFTCTGSVGFADADVVETVTPPISTKSRVNDPESS